MNNHYDNEQFFEKYSQMNRSVLGLEGAGEWKTLEPMLPDFSGKSVLDLGCGFGWHCLYAAQHGAKQVRGVDLSQKMLHVAAEKIAQSGLEEVISLEQGSMEAVFLPENTYDVVLSSLALHYVADFAAICRKVFSSLKPGGSFVFSVEHPIFTAYGNQDWLYDSNGTILCWPVDRYFLEGERQAVFLGETIQKQHKTLTTYLHTLLSEGFQIIDVQEPQPPQEMMHLPGMADELRRPMMLLVSAKRPGL